MKRIIVALASIVLLGGATPIDWKYFGETTHAGAAYHNFFLASRIDRKGDHAQVWTKEMDAKVLSKVTMGKDGIERSAAKLSGGYMPPIAKAQPLSKGQLVDIIMMEEYANEASIDPQVQFLWEFDCRGKVARTLATMVKGKMPSDIPTSWMHVPPQSIGDNLMTVICQ
jgi:hypothetical protein